jgi:YesN/AraC family two-component response regulator
MKSATMEMTIEPGDFIFIPANTRYDHYSTSENVQFYIIAFAFKASEGKPFDEQFGLTKITAFNQSLVLQRFQSIFKQFEDSITEKLLAVSDFYKFFSEILPFLNQKKPQKIHPVLDNAMNYINEHITENFSIKNIADFCHINGDNCSSNS